ncbi:insulator binding factor 1 isoform 2-T6 [Glossina fuscipes fuscipes]
MVGRKIGKGYQLYGFTHCIIKGKHVAKCKICDKELQNTAEARMRAHWSACAVTPASKDIHELTHESACKRQIGCSGRSNNLDYAKRARTDNDLIREGENASIRDEKVNILNCPEARKGRDNIALNELPSSSSSKSSKDSRSGKTYENVMKAKLEYFKQKTNYLNREMDNMLIERNVMILKIEKLNNEIIKLEMDREHSNDSVGS